jgi:hypothetical protein
MMKEIEKKDLLRIVLAGMGMGMGISGWLVGWLVVREWLGGLI